MVNHKHVYNLDQMRIKDNENVNARIFGFKVENSRDVSVERMKVARYESDLIWVIRVFQKISNLISSQTSVTCTTWETPGMCRGRRGQFLDDVLKESGDPLLLPRAPLALWLWPVLIDIRGENHWSERGWTKREKIGKFFYFPSFLYI